MPFTIDGEWIPSKEEPQKVKPVKVRSLKRKGVVLTVVLNLDTSKHNLKEIAKELKTKLGIGGSVKDGSIELQGKKEQEVKAILKELGIRSQ